MKSISHLFLALVSICHIAVAFAQTESTNQQILDAHDAARYSVGAGPPVMFWNESLAIYAQNYANAIRNANACGSTTPSGNTYQGENIATSPGFMNAVAAVGKWTAEQPFYTYPANTCATGKICSHYTQVVWKNSVGVGCAKVVCPPTGGNYVICSYFPKGNIVGQLPY